MTELENALISACKTFLTAYASKSNQPPQQRHDDSVRTQNNTVQHGSNGPKCVRHDKVMILRQGKRGSFYSCSARESDPNFSNQNGYCNSTADA